MGTFEGEKARRDDTVKGLVDPGPDKKPAPTKAAGKDDHLCKLTDADDEKRKRLLNLVAHKFHWFNDAAQLELDKLRRHLKKEDEPDWFAQLAQSLLEIGLGAGAAAAGVHLAAKLAPAAGEVGKELVKMVFEGGIAAGFTA